MNDFSNKHLGRGRLIYSCLIKYFSTFALLSMVFPPLSILLLLEIWGLLWLWSICFCPLLWYCDVFLYYLDAWQLLSFFFFLTGFGFHGISDSKELANKVGDPDWIPGSGRPPGEGNGKPLQHSCLENPMDRGAWWATVHGVAKSRPWMKN